MGPLSYTRSIVDWNVVMWHISVVLHPQGPIILIFTVMTTQIYIISPRVPLPARTKHFYFPNKMTRPALRPIQPPIRVSAALSLRGEAAVA